MELFAVKQLIHGLASYVPGVSHLERGNGGGDTSSASYCYSVWMKHYALTRHATGFAPVAVAELGPGDSLGVGIAVLLAGASSYTALDAVDWANADMNQRVFHELVELFRRRAPRPVRGWPDYDHLLGDDLFPVGLDVTDRLTPEALAQLQHAIRYIAPWDDRRAIEPASVDYVLSHSTLEHVEQLEHTYRSLAAWVRPGGVMSHQIDLTAHGAAPVWDGYRAFGERTWRTMRGRRPFLINREPISTHLDLMEAAGFELIDVMKSYRDDGLDAADMASRWRSLSDDDRRCAGAFVIATRP